MGLVDGKKYYDGIVFTTFSNTLLAVFVCSIFVLELSNVLGVKLDSKKNDKNSDVHEFIDLLIDLRSLMRNKKDFESSDLIRDRLTDLGVKLEDSSGETHWDWID